jgi:ClpP class serine protease
MEYNAKVIAEIQSSLWSIDPDILTAMVGAVTADMGPRAEGARKAYKQGNVGFVDVNGPIVSRDSWLASFFGLNSVEQISADIRALESDDEITDIVLVMDTPGGTVTGLTDLSQQVAASSKRTTAYVSGVMASAGYWFGSAADTVVASDTALVGSIGVVATVTPWVEPGSVTVVSSQSPNKNLDPTKKEGLAALQKTVDALADIFIESVAKNRNVSVEAVQANYGQGATFLAKEALERGMIDGVSSFQNLVDLLATAARGETQTKGDKMDLKTLKTDYSDVFDAAVKIGIEAERKRAEAHLTLGEASGDLETAIGAIKAGDALDELYSAKYQAASMRKAQMNARAADNPPKLDGNVDPKSAKSEAELVADLVAEGLSFYTEGGLNG